MEVMTRMLAHCQAYVIRCIFRSVLSVLPMNVGSLDLFVLYYTLVESGKGHGRYPAIDIEELM